MHMHMTSDMHTCTMQMQMHAQRMYSCYFLHMDMRDAMMLDGFFEFFEHFRAGAHRAPSGPHDGRSAEGEAVTIYTLL